MSHPKKKFTAALGDGAGGGGEEFEILFFQPKEGKGRGVGCFILQLKGKKKAGV